MNAANAALLPSPSFKSLHIGPVQFRIYGLMIAIGLVAAVGLAERRWLERGAIRTIQSLAADSRRRSASLRYLQAPTSSTVDCRDGSHPVRYRYTVGSRSNMPRNQVDDPATPRDKIR